MDLDAVVAQLKAYVPLLNGRVAGAAQFARSVEDQTWMAQTAAYVVPLDEDADENPPGSGLDQHVTERFGVIVSFTNEADRQGQHASSQFAPMRKALWAALLNWRVDPVSAPQGLQYAGGQLLDFDRARLFYQWSFSLHRLLTDADGWQVPAVSLFGIEYDLVSSGQSGPRIQVDLPIAPYVE